MVLCYSRMLYVEFTLGQAMEHFLSCHQRAFEFFGAVPKRIMVDNLKCAVLRRMVGQAPVFNPRYRDFAHHYGFKITACNVGKGNEKGRVENAVGYIKKNFLQGLDIHDFAALVPVARQWMDEVANVRVHGTTRKQPLELFKKEKPALKPLPLMPPDTGVQHAVRSNSCFRVIFDTNRYSVPWKLASTRLDMRAYAEELYFYREHRLVARHARSYGRHQDFEQPDHVHELLQQRGRARAQQLVKRFLQLSPKAGRYYHELEQRNLNARHHVRAIVALSEIYGQEKTARALEDCLEFSVFSSAYVANVLEQRERKPPQAGALHLTRLVEGESDLRNGRSIQRRIKQARFPVIKTLEQL